MVALKYIKSLFLLSLFLLSNQIYATNVMGSDITYKCLGNNKYEITLAVYRDCNGLNLANPPLKASCGNNSKNFTLNLYSKTDVTGLNPKCQIFSRCSGNYKYGIEEHVFKGVINLDSLNCCNVTLSISICCRNHTITTGAAGANFYTEAIINKCITPCNSSPSISSKPVFIIPVGENFIFNNNVSDTVDVGDSLSFKLVNPLSGQGSKITYINNWSAEKPLSYLGFPNNAGFVFPAGFHLDGSTGNISFRPTVKDQITATALEVTEWRKINGVTTKVGVTRRDMQIIVIGSNNKPKATFENVLDEIAVCKLSGTLCKDIALTRPLGYTDTVELTYEHNLQNISFINVGSFSNPVIRVCYTPTIAEVNSNKALKFTIKATTNSCPFKGVAEKTIQWVERPPLPDSFAIQKTLTCRNLKLVLLNNSLNVNNASAVFEVKSPISTITKASNAIDIKDLNYAGWHYITMTVEDQKYCSKQVYYDSIYLPQSSFLKVQIPKDTMLCNTNSFSLPANTQNGMLPFVYEWSGDDTGSQQVLHTTVSKTRSKFIIKVTDANSCKFSDTINVRYYNPTVDISGDKVACAGDEVEVNAILKNTIKPNYQWVGFANGQTRFKAKVTQNSLLSFQLVDSSGCVINKTHFIRVYAPKAIYGHNKVYCESDSIVLSATESGGLAPYTTKWLPYNATGNIVPLGFKKRGFLNISTITTDAFGCVDTQKQVIRINPTPDFKFTGLPTLCESSPEIFLTNYIQPKKGIWSGEGVSSNYFRPYSVTPGKKKLTYFYMDSVFFCSNELSAEVEVDVHPVADFIADSVVGEYTRTFNFTNTSRYGDKHTFIWDFGDPNSGNANIETTLNSKHIFSDTGTYTIKLKVSGGTCPDDSIVKTGYIRAYKNNKPDSTTTSIKTINNNSLIIYPNPAYNELIVESKSRISKAIIYNTLGQVVVQKENIAENSIKLNIENLSKGLYILSIEGTKSIPFIKK